MQILNLLTKLTPWNWQVPEKNQIFVILA